MSFPYSLKSQTLRLLRCDTSLNFYPSRMTFAEMVVLAQQRKTEMPEGKSTTELFKKGVDGVGKKLLEEAAESWMAARFESHENISLELSQVLYYVACMMAEKGLTLEEVYAKL